MKKMKLPTKPKGKKADAKSPVGAEKMISGRNGSQKPAFGKGAKAAGPIGNDASKKGQVRGAKSEPKMPKAKPKKKK